MTKLRAKLTLVNKDQILINQPIQTRNFSIAAFYCIILTLCSKYALKAFICFSILPPGYIN